MDIGETNEILESIFHTTYPMIACLDRNMDFMRVNSQYAEFVGKQPDYFVGKNHFELYPHEENEAIFKRVVETGQAVSFHAKPFEYKYDEGKGITYWDWDLIPIKETDGGIKGLILSLINVTERELAQIALREANEQLEKRIALRTQELENEITERRQTEAALRRSKKRYREVFENTSDCIMSLDVTSDRQIRCASINPAMERLLKVSDKDCTGKTIQDMFPADISPDMLKYFTYCIRGKRTVTFEGNYMIGDVDRCFIITLTPLFNSEGEVYTIYLFCRDRTERKRYEENLRMQKDKAEQENVAKSEYLASMSHELRTPINVLLSALQLFNLYLGDNFPLNRLKLRERVKNMRQNCLRLLRLVNNLIDSTKIDADFYELNLKNNNISTVIEIITQSVGDYVREKNMNLVFRKTMDNMIIACDIDIIERVMLNLLSNAIKFSKHGGVIEVNLGALDDWITISVKDDGIGIPSDKTGVIFQRYRQVSELLTRSHEGSGIGLSLVKSLVEMHGGSITVESELGRGSEFLIKLPNKTLNSSDSKTPIYHYEDNSAFIEKMSVELSDIYN